ncbi:MraY family glycosyltransferase [Paenibacillus aceti]|uniref:MraY family glycosyltransferase n=1 Tax=Paenibacillus aceti TaxID=1820010 RepID=UPI000EA09F86|nr:MraY family glycosyltransferase [Paenibacillus aceti]
MVGSFNTSNLGGIIINYIAALVVSFLVVYVLIPPLRKFAYKIDFVDKPVKNNDRKIHKQSIPLTAGIAIFIGFVIAYLFFVKPDDVKEYVAILIGGSLILSIGLVDDWMKTQGKELSALPKLIVQVAAAVIVFYSGISFTGFTAPFSDEYIQFPVWLQLIFTVVWIFGVTTVINFSDGIDGLAGSLTSISSTTLFIVAAAKGQTGSAIIAIILIGVSLAYLRYNKPPAKVFMGDAGATFLGFMLGVVALDGALKQATTLSLFIPILALGVPIFDNIFVVIKRFINGIPVYKADASQAHYRLLRTGLNTKQVVFVLSLINICFGLFSIIILLLQNQI